MLLGASPVLAQQQQPTFDAGNLKVTWGVVTNGHEGKMATLSGFTIVNKGKTAFPASGWELYYNFVRPVKPAAINGVSLSHVNGDLYKITPTEGFKSIAPGDSVKIDLVSDAWVLHQSDAPAGLYLVWNSDVNKGYAIKNFSVTPSTKKEQLLRFSGDNIAPISAGKVYSQNALIQNIAEEKLVKVFPTPKDYKETSGTFNFNPNTAINTDPSFKNEAALFANEMSAVFGKPLTVHENGVGNGITLRKNTLPENAYTLEVTTDGITIAASSPVGIFYGLQSLKTLMPGQAWVGKQKSVAVTNVNVTDEPRFGYRSFMLDMARNFHSVGDVKKVIDVMALYKLNTLHFHFSDDEGWRIEMPSLPELTSVGAKRGHGAANTMLLPSYGSGPDANNDQGTGFYTKAQFIDILKYAQARHITVIPEIESPGHARAAVKSMDARYAHYHALGNEAKATEYLLKDLNEQSKYASVQAFTDNVMDAGLPSTYRFIETVVKDFVDIYKEAGVPLNILHLGGDELPHGAWTGSPAVAKLMKEKNLASVDDVWYYYYQQVYNILQKHNIQLYGWEEVGMRKTKLDGKSTSIPNPDFANKNVQVDVWNNILGGGAEDLAYRLANAGYKVVLSCVTNNYFDMAYEKSWDEPGFYWGGYIDVDKPFYLIPYDYFKNSKVDAYGAPLNKNIFIGKDRLTDFGKSNIVGIQGVIFSETTKTTEDIEYKLLPRLLGLAERAWAQDPAWAQEKDEVKAEQMYQEAWSHLANIIGKRELPRLANYSGGYLYRIPTAGAVVKDGQVFANVQFPGLTVRYTVDGKEPSAKSPTYIAPLNAKGKVKFRVFDSKGRGGRVIEIDAGAPVQVQTAPRP
ncbi:hexosaminidase [Chitinophaga skermanii]|uniref:beta-N-acetylhexosaminidase n=2 Tax=Chitinophaga skermanii TaxID=331697 RepID=A0A327R5R5_9BACT|nr:hexosaminidase [Chitinophaga skermanii]